MSAERWLAVPGYEDRYEISDLGRIWSLRRNRLMSPSLDKYGYPFTSLNRGGGDKTTLSIHQLVMLAFVGPKPFPGAQVRHLNGIKSDARLVNLKYGTQTENNFDRTRLGEWGAPRTHCKNGHLYDSDNTYEHPAQRGRGCRACHREAQRRYVERRALAS